MSSSPPANAVCCGRCASIRGPSASRNIRPDRSGRNSRRPQKAKVVKPRRRNSRLQAVEQWASLTLLAVAALPLILILLMVGVAIRLMEAMGVALRTVEAVVPLTVAMEAGETTPARDRRNTATLAETEVVTATTEMEGADRTTSPPGQSPSLSPPFPKEK